jgi:hypothetical protein
VRQRTDPASQLMFNQNRFIQLEIGEVAMDILIIAIILLLLFGGGGGLYWGMGGGWGIGPIGLIIAVVVIAFLLNGYRGRHGPRL